MDSTFLAYTALEQGCDVTLLHSEGFVTVYPLKQKQEALSVKAIVHFLREKYPQQTIKLITVRGPFMTDLNVGPGFGGIVDSCSLEAYNQSNGLWYQLPMWITAASSVVSEEHHEVQIGIHGEDMILAHRDAIMKLWDANLNLKKLITRPLTLPLEKLRKGDVIRRLPNELLGLTWFCEKPVRVTDDDIRCCGLCTPCNTFIGALATDIDRFRDIARHYAKTRWSPHVIFPLNLRKPKATPPVPIIEEVTDSPPSPKKTRRPVVRRKK